MRSLWTAVKMLRTQRELIEQQHATIEELQRCVLVSHRICLDLAVAWRLSSDMPEVDVHEDLDTLISDLSNSIAKTEEYVL